MQLMKIISSIIFLVAFCNHRAEAGGCSFSDKWRGPDKVLHAQAGAAIGFVGAMNRGSWVEGVAWSAAAGGLKELSDLAGNGQCSLQDLLVTIAGGAIGSGLGAQVAVWKTGQTTYVGINFALK